MRLKKNYRSELIDLAKTVMDEPTNNLDIQNIEILPIAINEYEGTLVIVSHDTYFLDQLRIKKVIILS